MPTSTIQVLDRAVDLLDALSRAKTAMSLKFLSLETGLHPSTAFRILGALQEHQLVYKTDRGDYLLGDKLSHYARRLENDAKLRQCAEPVMRQLGESIQQPVYLSVRHGDDLLFINSTDSVKGTDTATNLRLPLHLSSVGKLILAEMGEAELDSYIQRTGLNPLTEYSVCQGEQLRAQLERAREQQLALQREEAQLGSACVGVLIRDQQQQTLAGLSVICRVQQLEERWGELLQRCANEISHQWQGLATANLG